MARLYLALVAAFWLWMNFLLWRAEFGRPDDGADEIPVALVWKRILMASDASGLTIWQKDRRLGFGRWITGIGEEMAELEDAPPEGAVEKIRSYRLRLDGNLTLPEEGLRLRFDSSVKLATNQAWQEFTLRISSRPAVWELRALAAEETVRFHFEDGNATLDRAFAFSQLRNPQAVVAEFAGPAALGWFGVFGTPLAAQGNELLAGGPKWEAHSLMLTIGREPVRVFRLQTRVLDRYWIRIYVSRAGEILLVQLPNDITLIHDQVQIPRLPPP